MIETTTQRIDIPYPDAADLHLSIAVGACRLGIAPSDGGAWVQGSYDDPSGLLPARVDQEGGNVRLTQAYHHAHGWRVPGRVSSFTLGLGLARPFKLTLETGASEATLDLGGVPVTRLVLKQGAGKTSVDFSAPNPQAMSLLDVGAGAVSIDMRRLANANCAEMRFEGGAAGYVFDFGGTLARDAHATISTGLSSVELVIPATTAAKVATESVLGSTDVGEGFRSQSGGYWTQAAVAGHTPLLTVQVSVALGSLRLRTGATA